MNILETYTRLYEYSKNENKRVELVMSQIDSQLYILKEMTSYDLEIYQLFKNNPISCIPRVYHLIHEKNRLIVIKEFIHMTTLEEYALNHRMGTSEIRQIIIKISTIVQSLHQLPDPIIHCDLNLTNIFYNGKELYLNDFDIAKLYSKHEIITMGSRGYAPPEQYEKHTADFQNDIYALGMIYKNLLKMNNLISSAPDQKIIHLMCEHNKEKRIYSIDEVLIKINNIL